MSAPVGRVLLVQPPFVQLNAPYPAPYYLRSFLEARGAEVRVEDHSIGLFSRVFSRSGLERVFAAARPGVRALLAGKGGEPAARLNLARYLSQEADWLSCVDRLTTFLRGADREYGHLLSAANGALPAGHRALARIEASGGAPGPDEAPALATALISDLADFIAATVDGGFSLVRYAESLAAGLSRWEDARGGADGWILKEFYEPLLEETWRGLEEAGWADAGTPFVLGATVPFPGCLAGALALGRSAKKRFGSRVRVVLGGGYVNTELRSLKAAGLFDYVDCLSYDRGYGSLAAILARAASGPGAGDAPLYKTLFRGAGGALVGGPDAIGPEDGDYARLDADCAGTVFPDYRGVDFSRYLRPVDDANPMHRLWSDGRWLKAYLAHGCYWRACAFCDVQLDYIRGFQPTDAGAFFRHMAAQAETTGVRGIHLVDEAAPVGALLELARLNRAAGLPLSFWGNVRFEMAFTPDAAALLSAGGFLGASAGIEVASEAGFKRVGKGLGLPEVVSACAAFKEAGVLVHAYLIFGFWDEDDQETIDSAETLRQLFKAGLLDSAFWHKFVLTRHSRIMREKAAGRHGELEPLGADDPDRDFAANDLRFRGEERSEKWSAPLDALAAAWMAGENLETPLRDLLPFKAPRPRVAPDLVDGLLAAYAERRDAAREKLPAAAELAGLDAVFLGSAPVAERGKDGGQELSWHWRFERRRLKGADAALAPLLARARNGMAARDFLAAAETARGAAMAPALWRALRGGGLVLVPAAAGTDKP